MSGGGAKGYFQAQLWHRIEKEFNITPAVIAGVSVGALNGAMVAQGNTRQLIEIWKNIREKDVYKRRSLSGIAIRYGLHKIGISRPPLGAYDNSPLFDLIKEHVDYHSFKIPLKIGRVNLNTGRYKFFINHENIHRQILASTAIPVIWSPVSITEDGVTHQWVDGGIRNVTPLGDVLSFDPDLVLIMPTAPYDRNRPMRNGDKKDLIEVGLKALDIMMDEIFFTDIDRFLDTNELVKQIEKHGEAAKNRYGKTLKYFDYLVLGPTGDQGSALDFSKHSLEYRRDHANILFDNKFRDQIRDKLNGDSPPIV